MDQAFSQSGWGGNPGPGSYDLQVGEGNGPHYTMRRSTLVNGDGGEFGSLAGLSCGNIWGVFFVYMCVAVLGM